VAPSLRGKTIGMIGAGHMGQALIRGLRSAGVPATRLLVVEPKAGARRMVTRRDRVEFVRLTDIASRCDVGILAVKPQEAAGVLRELAGALSSSARRRMLVISIAAGLRLRAIERELGRAAVVRVMPNLAAKVGCAISAMAAGRWATRAHRETAEAIFQSVGEVVALPERHFDAVTALSGSGPAYFFLIFQALRDAGVRQGLPKAVAQRLAVETAKGAAALVDGLGEELEALIAQVASKRGTTERALRVFQRRRLPEALAAGVEAAAKRSKELSCLWSGN